MDVVFLARIQFAANITFHILFPSISIALGWVLLFFRLKHLRATDPQQKLDWLRAYRLWTKIFALTFALGVVSGVTMSFQFGTNWPGYMERVGNIAGPLLGYEVLTAFFLEAGFLGVMLFGHRRVGEMVHLGSTFLVAFGTMHERILDPCPQFLDADAGGIRNRRWPVSRARTGWKSSSIRPSRIASST